MINHGDTEARLASELCVAANRVNRSRFGEPGLFSLHRPRPPVPSCWTRS
jgi:hypothetical protein